MWETMWKKELTKEKIESEFTADQIKRIEKVATTTPLLLETLIEIPSSVIDKILILTKKKIVQGKTPVSLVQQACYEIFEVFSYDPESMIWKAK